MSGKVIDPDAAPVSCRTWKVLASPMEPPHRQTTSNQRGEFHLAELNPGKYTLNAEVSAFAPISLGSRSRQRPAHRNRSAIQANRIDAPSHHGSRRLSAICPNARSLRTRNRPRSSSRRQSRPPRRPRFDSRPADRNRLRRNQSAAIFRSRRRRRSRRTHRASSIKSAIFYIPIICPANAHGNGYADPNFLIAPIIEAVSRRRRRLQRPRRESLHRSRCHLRPARTHSMISSS